MAGKKQTRADQRVPPEEPRQELAGGTVTGLPTRKRVFGDLAKIAKKPAK